MNGRHRWLVEYINGDTRVVWADFREPLNGGQVCFYNAREPGQPVNFVNADHVLLIQPGIVKEVFTRDDFETLMGTLDEIGKPEELQRRERQQAQRQEKRGR